MTAKACQYWTAALAAKFGLSAGGCALAREGQSTTKDNNRTTTINRRISVLLTRFAVARQHGQRHGFPPAGSRSPRPVRRAYRARHPALPAIGPGRTDSSAASAARRRARAQAALRRRLVLDRRG